MPFMNDPSLKCKTNLMFVKSVCDCKTVFGFSFNIVFKLFMVA